MKAKLQKNLIVMTALTVALAAAFPLHAAIDQRTPNVLLEGTTTQLTAASWSELLDIFRRDEESGGGRSVA